jgi:hypothetical protein
MFGDITRNFTVRVIEVSEDPDSGHTSSHTGRFLPFFDELDAEAALLDVALFLDDPHVVRASGDAVFAADAIVLIDQNDAVLSLMRCPCWADLDAGRVVTVLALDREKLPCIVWEVSVLPLLKMVIGLLLPKAVLILAGHPTGMTAYTLRLIDQHSVPSHIG